MKNTRIKNRKMNPDQFSVFLFYWGLGNERSIDRLLQDWDKIGTKIKKPHRNTLGNWSDWFNWQVKVIEMDEEANKKLYDEAVGAARQTRVEIMKVFRAVILRFAEQLRKDPAKSISSFDIATFWKMARIEMGMPSEHGKTDHDISGNLKDLLLADYGETKRDNTKKAD